MAVSKEVKELIELAAVAALKEAMKTNNAPVASGEVLKTAIEEQRRVYDELDTASQQVKIKTLTLLGGGLAVLTFLYANPDEANPLFLPPELYGRLFYLAGLILTGGAIGLLLFATKPYGEKEVPTEIAKLADLSEEVEVEFLEYVNSRYIACFKHNSKQYHFKLKLLNIAFYPLIFGAIILVVLKIFRAQ